VVVQGEKGWVRRGSCIQVFLGVEGMIYRVLLYFVAYNEGFIYFLMTCCWRGIAYSGIYTLKERENLYITRSNNSEPKIRIGKMR
jgi:hypothetical protein